MKKLFIEILCTVATWRDKRIYIKQFGETTNNIEDAFVVRYIICRTKKFNIYIHKFLKSDDQLLHDHPWDFISFVINGHIYEEFVNGFKVKREKGFYLRDADTFHRVVLDKEYKISDKNVPTTLVICYNRRKNWNYLVNNKPVNWRKYFKCLNVKKN